jgi:hypothetical protein
MEKLGLILIKSIGYEEKKDVEKIPFCPECHSYPCACDDNI